MVGPRTRRNTGRAPTNDNGTLVPTPAVFRALTTMPTQAPTPTLAPAYTSVLGLPGRYTDKAL